MRAWFACTGAAFLAMAPGDVVGRLASAQQARGLPGAADQEFAWKGQVDALRRALSGLPGAASWTLALEFDLLRLERRIDAVLLTDRAILALEFKTAPASASAMAEAEDYALDLRDFHAGSRRHAIIPVLVAGEGAGFVPPAQAWLLPKCPTETLTCGPGGLAALVAWVQSSIPDPDRVLDGAAWLAAPYRPVPSIIEAATLLYARNGVAEIAAARADAANLTRTAEAIARAVAAAERDGARTVVFVTGIPGAGKTLCGLNAVFGPARQQGAAFLTGNMPLVAVLREALARDAIGRGTERREAERRVKAALQNVHRFLEDNAADPAALPPERLIVFDEAQRAWDAAKARLGTRNRPSRLTMSEPAHTLEIMGRRPGWAVVVALIGQGQEINTGEAGLEEWGRVLEASAPAWRAVAAARVLAAPDPAQRLADTPRPWLAIDDALHLSLPLRSVAQGAGAAWVDAVLAGDAARAREVAASPGGIPFLLTRDLEALRLALRHLARGQRRAGLLRSSGAKRLRADGLAAEVEAGEVPDWFLNRWPDVRASDALEAAATEYACQGLELDVAGLAWGGDFLHDPRQGWQARRFAGLRWLREVKEAGFVRNTYRVLLTRARYETVIWIPRGSDPADPWHDATRAASALDATADFLLGCGARRLEAADLAAPVPAAAPALL